MTLAPQDESGESCRIEPPTATVSDRMVKRRRSSSITPTGRLESPRFAREPDRLLGTRQRARSPTAPHAGLGLAIAEGLVTAMGGRMWAENQPGGGARV